MWQSAREEGCSAGFGDLDRHDYLAYLLVGLEIGIRLDDAFQTFEGTRDHRLEMPAGQAGEDFRLRRLKAVGMVPDLARYPPAHRQAFHRARPVGVGRRLLAETAVNE